MTLLFLAVCCILGILTHNLMKIDKLNRTNPGSFNLKKFMSLEWASNAISVCVMCAFLIGQHMNKELQLAGWKLCLGFFCIGLAAQSIAYWLKNRSETEVRTKVGGAAATPDTENPSV